MKRAILFIFILFTISVNAQEGTKQLMPNSNDRLWLEFNVFSGNDFGNYSANEKERIHIYLNAGETMHFGMKMYTASNYGGNVLTNPSYVDFRIKDPNGTVIFAERDMVTSGNGYISSYTEAVTGPNGVVLNGTTISGGYDGLTYTAATTGNHYIEFNAIAAWPTFRTRFALEYFDVTVTDASNNVITNPGEPNKSAGRLWSKGWTFTNTSFTEYPVNAHFYVFTSDEFINKINFKMYPYSFTFVVNSYGVTTYTEENYIKRTQSLDGDQTTGDDISEYRVFMNDPDRFVWPNTTFAPPRVQVWTEDTLFLDYNYNRNPLYLPLDHDQVVMEKNRSDCPYEDVAIFKIECNIAGFTAILIDVDKDGEYSSNGSDRVIYRNMKKGLNYILWDFKTDAGAVVATGDYTASSTFLGRGPAHFPLYDVEQMDGIITSSIRPFNKLNTTIYWDDSQITRWGDQDGGDLMDETQQKQLVVENDVPRIWSYHSALANIEYNGNKNTMNTWFNALDLGYSNIGLHVQESDTKCLDGLAPWVGDVYIEGPKDTDIEFDSLDFTYKFFDPREYNMDSIQVLSLPENGSLKLSTVAVILNQKIYIDDIEFLTFTPTSGWHGETNFEWKAKNGDRWSNNQEKVYLIINTEPTISDIPDQTLCTNSATSAIPFTIGDAETDVNDLEVTGFSANPNFVPNSGIVIGGSGANRTVTITPVANKSGNAIIYIMVDDGYSQVIEEFTVYVGPDLQFSGDTTVCVGDDLYLIAQETGADSYSWKYDGTERSSTQSIQQTAGSVDVGSWSLTVEKDGCTSTRNFTVSVSPLTTFAGDVDVCVGETLSLSATEVNAVYSWKKGITEVSTSKIFTIPSAALGDAASDYTLYVSKDGCENTSPEFEITVKLVPNTGLSVSGNTVDPDKDGTITISNAENGITYNVYNGTDSITSGAGAGANLDITVSHVDLSIGDNIFIIKADNGNCEVELTNQATIHVNTPGITVSAISGNTIEDGTTATFTIVLDTEPTNNVTIGLSSNDATEGSVSPANVTFTSANWNTLQTITVTGVNDFVVDGNQTYTIITAAATSSDPNYNGLDADDITVINEDDDIAGVTVNPTSGLTTTEAGGTDNFTIRLTSQPTANVIIDLTSNNTDEGTVLPASVTFDDTNWNSEQTITVTGVDDDIDDGDQNYTIVSSLTSSTDINYNGLLVSDVELTNIDNDIAGITVNPTSGLTTSETGSTAQFTIVLNTKPTANVSIGISSGDPTEGSVSPTNLTFTLSNWNTPQTITISGVNDNLDDGDILYTIITASATSTDTKYNGINADDVSVTNTDDDVAGITVNPTSGLTTTESGGTAGFTIVLDTEPTADVSIGISSDDATEGSVSPISATFTSVNWNTPQTITVTGLDDFIDDGDITYSVITAAATSTDGNYSGMNAVDVSVTNTDNDAAGVTVSPTSIGTTEAGGTGIFSVVLTSQPSADVTISFTGIDASEGTIDKTSVTFTSASWNTAQNVTVTGVDDAVVDGNVIYTITTTATSTDGLYNGITVADVTVTNADDDIAGITVTPISGLTTTEAGGQATFTIALNTQPTHDVTINIASSDLTEGTVSPASITFTNADYAAKTITVTGVNDNVADGDIGYTIQTSNSSSTDPNYNNKPVDDVSVTNTDNDAVGITVSAISGNTTEAGGTATFTIVLNSEPTANVSIALSSDDIGEGTVSSPVNFTSGNWDTPQTITVTGVNDNIDDGNIEYHIITAAASGGDYAGINADDITVINEDDDTAGITVNPTSGLTTSEAGGTATFTIVLTSQPTADVTIGLSSSNTSEGTVSPAGLTFTSGNWNTAQIVTVTGVDDNVDDGDQAYTIYTAQTLSTDPNYSVINPTDVSVSNTDDDTAGITVSPTSGLTTTEAGGTASFTIVLDSEPTASVSIVLSSDDIGEGTVSSPVNFTSGNWDTPQTITVTGVNDNIDDGNIAYTIVTASAISSDGNYNGIDANDVSVTNTDDDIAGITVSGISGNTAEDGTTATFTIVLDSEPTHDVTIGISSSNIDEGTVSPVSLVFTSANWDTPQTVTVTGVDDDVDDGDIAYSIITAVATSTDGNYNGMNADDVSVTNTDDDDAGFVVEATAGLYTREDGTQATFTIRLSSEPTADVTIDLESSDITEGTVSPASVTFTSTNWNSDQLVTITGVDDNIDDGDIAYNIITHPAVSTDPLYSAYDPINVSVTNQDDDLVGITVNPTILTINEEGTAQTFSIVLNSEPTHDVSIDISSDNINKGTVLPANITFTSANWNTAQDITVTPVDNDIDDGDIVFNIITVPAVSDDDNYKNRNAADVAVTSIDNDEAGITVSAISGNTSEDGTTATFTIVLDSEPTADVTIGISSSNTDEGTVLPVSITFTSGNWNTQQTVTVTGVDDVLADGNQTYYINFATTVSTDGNYGGIDLSSIEVVNADDDSPGVTVFPISGLETTEAEGTATFTVRLNSQPADDVVINTINSDDTSEGTVTPGSLTFTNITWNTPQTVTITGVDDLIDDGDIPYNIELSDAASTDGGYDGLTVPNVSVTNIDDTGPRAADDAATTDEDSDINIDVLNNDLGLDNGGLILSITSQANHGTLTIESDNTITYHPDGLFNGDDAFTYRVCDVEDACDEATVTVSVAWMDDQPVAVGDFRGTSKNTDVIIDVLFNDYGLEDGGIVVSINEVPIPSQGTVVLNGDNITFTPAADYLGLATFIYEITDIDGDSDTAIVSINVREVNSVPDAVNDAAETIENEAVDINVLANDTGLDDGFGSLAIYNSPANGTVTINTNRTITYTPATNFTGNDSFKYIIEDVDGDYDTATVIITVSEKPDYLPVANDDTRGTEYETAVTVDILTNDTGLEDGVQNITISSVPVNGNVIVNIDFTVTYTPNNGFAGIETLGYQVCDNDGDCATATVIIIVKEDGVTNYLPLANDDTAETLENTAVDINVLANDTGLDDGFGQLIIFTQPINGTVVINTNRIITYTPFNMFIGDDSFVYWIEDLDGDYDTATVVITVSEKPDYEPVANADSRGTEYETAVIVDVLTNDTGLEDGGIIVSIESTSSNGTATVNTDNTITFTPATGYSGITSFEYRVTDGNGDFSVATVTINVKEEGVTNYLPLANDDTAETLENIPVDINVLANDTGLDDGFGQLLIFTQPINGTVVINTNRTITYTPFNMFIGDDSFVYWIEDIDGDYDTATVVITVSEKPDYEPVANADARGTEYETAVIVNVLTNDTGLEDGGIVVSIESASSNGSATVNAGNTITFTPTAGYSGITSFEYRVTDGDGDFSVATVTITVKEEGVTNYVPLANDDTAETLENIPVDINVLANDTGLDDGFGQLLIFTQPINGTVVINTNRTITYTPFNMFIGDDSFVYWIEDIDGDYDTATVIVTVREESDYIPVANADARGTEYETAVIVDVLTNDTGLEDDGIIVSIESASSNGLAEVNTDNTITFTPATGYSGITSFEYRVTDGDGDYSVATVTITVKEDGVTNYVPVANDDKVFTNINTDVTIEVLGNDSGLEDGGILLTIYSDASNGSVIINTDNTVTYSPESWFEGTDNFTYKLTDIDGDYDIADVEVIVMSGTLPGITVSAISGNTAEDGTIANFTVVLGTQPAADVNIDLNSDNSSEGIISDTRLTFTTSNWDTPQTITITGQDDDVDDGDISYRILTDNALSADPIYNGLSISNVDVINIDDDDAGIIVITGTNETSEDGTSTSFKLVLNSEPLADVLIELASDDISEGYLEIIDVLFTSENWADTVLVIVNGEDDDEVDGNINYQIVLSPAVSTDLKYDGLELDDISLVNIDDDSKELIIPEAFSPGDDGFNDYFHIVNLEHYDKASIRIYNRWGSLVYSKDNYKNDWDGRASKGGAVGSKLPTGTYYYVLEISDNGEKKNGYVFIKR